MILRNSYWDSISQLTSSASKVDVYPLMEASGVRSSWETVEIRLDFNSGDEDGFPNDADDVRKLLREGGVLDAGEDFPAQPLPGDRMGWYASLLAQTVLLFQRKAGHRVDWYSLLREESRNR